MEEGVHVSYSALPALVVFFPLAAALAVRQLAKLSATVRNIFVVAVTVLTLFGVVAFVPLVAVEHRIGCEVPLMLGSLTFTVDAFGMLFALVASFVWVASTLYSMEYMKHERAHDRCHTTSLVVLSAMLGVVLAGDLITLYLFFEALGLVAFLFVIHTETDEAKAASVKYFWMTVIGGFALFGGIMLTYALGGEGAIAPLPANHGAETLRWAAFALLVLGFGVKAGMLPVHVWLPDAHPVAPSPASALLSGVMIKAGAYGIFRTVSALFRPEVAEHVEAELWHASAQFGLVVLWIGIATMFIGVGLALGQHNAKRMLAYHSVSQMGFILAGLGAAGYLGSHGAMGIAGGLFHVVNHALFKACLFLGVGAVFYRTGELDMYKLGGLWKRMPGTFVFMTIAAAGITGVPLFNGFVSKCLIHHALVEAWEYHGLWSLGLAEKIFIVTCGGTACSFIKLIGFVFLGKPKTEYGPRVTDAPPLMLVAMGMLSAAIVALGAVPQLLIKGVFQPGAHLWGVHPEILDEYLGELFMSPADVMSVVIAFAIGFTVFTVGMKFGLFHLHAPKWFGVDYWYRRVAVGTLAFSAWVDGWYELFRAAISRALQWLRVGYRAEWAHAERSRRRWVLTLTTGAPALRDQHFVQEACITLERERQATVRYAVNSAIEWCRGHPDMGPAEKKSLLDSVRDIAEYMAQRLFKERMGVISDMVRSRELDSVRGTFARVAAGLYVFREPVAETAMDLGRRRVQGENVLREISRAMNRVLGEERFDLKLRRSVPNPRFAGQLSAVGVAASGFVPRLAGAVHYGTHEMSHSREMAVTAGVRAIRYGTHGMSRLELTGKWTTDMARVVIAAITQERTTWTMAQPFDTDSVVYTRRQIQRYARDMSFNVAMLVVILLAFLVSLSSNL